MGEASTAPLPATGRHQRRLRNYLLDSHFQLKYTSYLVGIALLFSISLGLLIWRTSVASVTTCSIAIFSSSTPGTWWASLCSSASRWG